jgi:propionate CoA-transferase
MAWPKSGLSLSQGHERPDKIATASAAASLIRDGDTLAIAGGLGRGIGVLAALEERFLAARPWLGEVNPRNLTLVCPGRNETGRTGGLNRLAHPGLVRRLISGAWTMPPRLRDLAVANQIEAYALPRGVIVHMIRASAGFQDGHITRVGLGTQADPRRSGGRVNPLTAEQLVRRITVAGSDALFYPALRINVGLIPGASADVEGNLTLGREMVRTEVLAIAMAARASGGIVIAQVDRVLPHDVRMPDNPDISSTLVDRIVVSEPYDPLWETFTPPVGLTADPKLDA